MTFKDLKKRISNNRQQLQQQDNLSNNLLRNRLRDKPFWIWDIEEHKEEDIKTKGKCCFNHIIGLPTKAGSEKPLFDYQKILYDALLDNDYSNTLHHTFFKHKHLWIKRARRLV